MRRRRRQRRRPKRRCRRPKRTKRCESPKPPPRARTTMARATMSIQHKTLKLCSCNKTIALDAAALAAALKSPAPLTVHTELCRKEAARLQGSLGDAELLVACTQEAPLFNELAQSAGSTAVLRFVNILQAPGWST